MSEIRRDSLLSAAFSLFRRKVIFVVMMGFVWISPGDVQAETARGLAHYIMGVSYEFEDQLEAAAQEYRASVTADPSSFPAYLRLGIVSSALGDNRTAVKSFQAASRIDPEDLQSRYLLALAYSSAGEFDRSAEQYETLLKAFILREPDNPGFYIYLAQLYSSMGRINEALVQFEKLLVLQPKNTEALLLVGSAYLDRDKRTEGVSLLKRCVEIDPAQIDCLNALGYSYAEEGVHLDLARDLILRALAVEPDNAAYLDSLGWVYYKEGKLTEALDMLHKAAALQKDPTIFDHIGDVYEKMGKIPLALEAWREALAIDAAMADVVSKVKRAENAGRKP